MVLDVYNVRTVCLDASSKAQIDDVVLNWTGLCSAQRQMPTVKQILAMLRISVE